MYVIPALSLLSEVFPFSIAPNKAHQGQDIGMQTPPRHAKHTPNHIYTTDDDANTTLIDIASSSRSVLNSAIVLHETATGIPIMPRKFPALVGTANGKSQAGQNKCGD